jgi:hypothetical protein
VTPSLPIGTIVIFNGRAYRFCGITPASVQPTMASLEDLRTGARSDVLLEQLSCSPQSPDRSSARCVGAGS